MDSSFFLPLYTLARSSTITDFIFYFPFSSYLLLVSPPSSFINRSTTQPVDTKLSTLPPPSSPPIVCERPLVISPPLPPDPLDRDPARLLSLPLLLRPPSLPLPTQPFPNPTPLLSLNSQRTDQHPSQLRYHPQHPNS